MNEPAAPRDPHGPEVQAALERLSRGMQRIAERIMDNEERQATEERLERPPPRAGRKKGRPLAHEAAAAPASRRVIPDQHGEENSVPNAVSIAPIREGGEPAW